MSYYVGDRSPSGKKHGVGQFKWGPKSPTNRLCSYAGHFSNNAMQGAGVFTYPDGTVFTGSFVNDKKHGFGTFKYSNGNVYEGDIFYDVLTGGTFYLKEKNETFNIQLQYNEERLADERVYDAVLVQKSPSRGAKSCIIWGQGRWRLGSFLTFEKVAKKPKPFLDNVCNAEPSLSSDITLSNTIGHTKSIWGERSGMSISSARSRGSDTISTCSNINSDNATLNSTIRDLGFLSEAEQKEANMEMLAKNNANQKSANKISNLFFSAEIGLRLTEKVEKERLAKERLERDRQSREQAERERLAKIEDDRLAAEEAERAERARENKENAVRKLRGRQEALRIRLASDRTKNDELFALKVEKQRLLKIEADRKIDQDRVAAESTESKRKANAELNRKAEIQKKMQENEEKKRLELELAEIERLQVEKEQSKRREEAEIERQTKKAAAVVAAEANMQALQELEKTTAKKTPTKNGKERQTKALIDQAKKKQNAVDTEMTEEEILNCCGKLTGVTKNLLLQLVKKAFSDSGTKNIPLEGQDLINHMKAQIKLEQEKAKNIAESNKDEEKRYQAEIEERKRRMKESRYQLATSSPSLSSSWSSKEDRILEALVERYGPNNHWVTIASELNENNLIGSPKGGRTAKACLGRWQRLEQQQQQHQQKQQQ